jgi:ElaB/YqjD/DUF883 family membrane-anchored ribosome-binding protein
MSRMSEGKRAGEGAHAAAQNLKDSAAQVGENLRDMGGQVKDAAKEQYERLRDQASEYYEHGREQAREWQHNLESYVQEKPVKSLLIAAGVGVLLGMLWRRH